ncbi:MAG: SurA N-terminal domain-containing protein [Candidatus Endonucleobacter bathymodioli]|uniref:Periplasmic chaperone PpiD n=1 Tax=Candidatus Endonucleibacter bathymodioli TaxID=539814 RepID=A0AA90STI8_9GAMM|nr:SurA N-terminal domain-containing protein [Candidatus Endonucleobacter bathymodioli]
MALFTLSNKACLINQNSSGKRACIEVCMLQLMRDKAKSWVTIIIIAIIAFMLAITGLETLGPNRGNPNVASVNGQDITQEQLYRFLDQQKRMLMGQMGDQFDPSMIDEKVFTEAVLKSLIDRTLQLQDAQKQNMDIGQDVLDSMIVNMPEFQNEGRFDQTRFKVLIRNIGMTPLQFKEMLREEKLLAQLREGFSASEFVTTTDMVRLASLENQTRDISWLKLSSDSVRKTVTISDEETLSFYNENQDQFIVPEKVIVSYIELNKAELADTMNISDEDIDREYQARITDLKNSFIEKQKVSSILIASGSKRTPEEAQERANEVIRKLEKEADFEKLAKEYSDDLVTAKKGGNMGFIEEGFYGEAFDHAVASLKVGQTSGVIETAYGLHILKLTERAHQELPSAKELRDSIISSLESREVEHLFFERNRQLADISFEAMDLNQPSEQLGLTIKTTAAFDRNGGTGITANKKIIDAAFSKDVLVDRINSEVIELSPQVSLVLRVKEYHESQLTPLDDVKSSIISSIKREKTQKQLKEQAEQLIANIKSGDAKQVAENAGLSWSETQGVNRKQPAIDNKILAKAFKMPYPGTDKSELAYTELLNGDVAIVLLSAVYPGKYTDSDQKMMAARDQYIARNKGRNIYNEYLEGLKADGNVDIRLKDKNGS